MAETLTLKPLVSGTLGAGGTTQELIGGSGVRLTNEGSEALLPPAVHEPQYAESPDSEGGAGTRTVTRNPTGVGRVVITGTDSADFKTKLADWQETIEAVRRYGGTLTYTRASGTAVIYDIPVGGARITAIVQDKQIQLDRAAFSTFELDFRPYARYASYNEVTNASGADPLLEFDVTNVPGSELGLGYLTLTEQAAASIDHVEVGIDDPRFYTGGGSPDLLLDKTQLVSTGFAGTTSSTVTGLWSANTWRATLLNSSVVVVGTGSLAHKGRHRIKLRCYPTNPTPANTGTQRVRLKWRVGSGSFTNNAWVTLPGPNNWYEIDLGLIDVPEVRHGTQSWEGQIEAYSSVVGDYFHVDYMKIIPAWRYFKARAPQVQGAALAVSAYDVFEQASGDGTALNGLTPTVGAGNWATSGDTGGDFLLTSATDVVRRGIGASTNIYTDGRHARIHTTTATSVSVQVDTYWQQAGLTLNDGCQGVEARCSGTTDFVLGIWNWDWTNFPPVVWPHIVVVTGSTTANTVAIGTAISAPALQDQWLTIRLTIDTAGVATLYGGPRGTTLSQLCVGQSAAILSSGTRGIFDSYVGTTNDAIRHYDNVIIADSLPSSGHVINASKTAIFKHDIAQYEPTSGTIWADVPSYEGSRMYLPPAGREGLDTRVVISHHPNDTDLLPATDVTNTIRADLDIIPRVLLSAR